MTVVRYIGPFIDGVEVPYGLGFIQVAQGGTVEVPKDLGDSLLDQPDNWERVKPSRDKKEATR